MSADVWIEHPRCEHCGPGEDRAVWDSLNVTYNLSKMLDEAGFVGWDVLLGMTARDAGEHILTMLDMMNEQPERWRAMNPSNGWGDYDSCLQGRMRAWAVLCTEAGPDTKLGGWL